METLNLKVYNCIVVVSIMQKIKFGEVMVLTSNILAILKTIVKK